MKLFIALVLATFAQMAAAEVAYTGIIKELIPNGQRMVVDGKTYRYSNRTRVYVNDKLAYVDVMRVGLPIKYGIKVGESGETWITEVHLRLPEKEASRIFEN